MKTEQDSDVERRLLLAIVLSMAILFGTPYVYQKLNLTPQPELAPTEVIEKPAPVATPKRAGEWKPAEAVTQKAVAPTDAVPREVKVETEDLRLTFTNVGAFLTSARLKGYASSEGEWLEILPQKVPAGAGGALMLRSSEEGLNRILAEATYEVSGPNAFPKGGFIEVSFSFRQENLEITKRIFVPEKGYQLRVEVELQQDGQVIPCAVQLGPGIGDPGEESSSDFQDPAIVFFQNSSVERYHDDDFEDGDKTAGNFRWAGLDSKYFAYVVIYPAGIRSLWHEKVELPPSDSGAEENGGVPLLATVADLGDATEFSVYLGPKNGDELSLVDPTLSQLIDFGEWLGVLVKPLLMALKFIHRYVGNYGWSIIILTFLINLALFPFRYKQMASMQKMSAVQPKLKSIQDKYKRMKKEDPRKQQMNAEVMALYKEHGVNPLGGCLPLLLQMPILFAFYRMLYTSIELRGAPFMLWIQDLSKPDPYYITPIVMGATMVAQQRMTPATGDPAQRRMMMFLPIVFTFFFLRVSSGLAIYFLFSNLVGMALQYLLQKFKPELTAKGKKLAGKQKGSK
jgi:YidC/Oxa1 family membrane protein insertase